MARHPALQAAVGVLARQAATMVPLVARATMDELLACATMDSSTALRWVMQNHGMLAHQHDYGDPYTQAHTAAERWLERYVQLAGHSPEDAVAVRAYGMVYYGGFKTAAGCMVRGYTERLQHPQASWGHAFHHPEPSPDEYLRCPYRLSQHRGASKGGGTFGHIYAHAWERGLYFANAQLARAAGRC